jgi:hypothetical protein
MSINGHNLLELIYIVFFPYLMISFYFGYDECISLFTSISLKSPFPEVPKVI